MVRRFREADDGRICREFGAKALPGNKRQHQMSVSLPLLETHM